MRREHQYWIYILTNPARNVMYVGVTNNLENRVAQHQAGEVPSFTRRYNVNTLVYAEEYDQIADAIAREKQIKGWRREKKNALVETVNPTWADLFAPGAAFKDPSLRSG
jgi:predicted GIY-YIG superfamily endonuclease